MVWSWPTHFMPLGCSFLGCYCRNYTVIFKVMWYPAPTMAPRDPPFCYSVHRCSRESGHDTWVWVIKGTRFTRCHSFSPLDPLLWRESNAVSWGLGNSLQGVKDCQQDRNELGNGVTSPCQSLRWQSPVPQLDRKPMEEPNPDNPTKPLSWTPEP